MLYQICLLAHLIVKIIAWSSMITWIRCCIWIFTKNCICFWKNSVASPAFSIQKANTNPGTYARMSTGRTFLIPYLSLHTIVKYFWYLPHVQRTNIFRGILTATKTFPRPLELQDVLSLTFWVILVPIWIFACSTILSGCPCCDVHTTTTTDALKCTSFHADVHPTSHWSSSLFHTGAHKKQ